VRLRSEGAGRDAKKRSESQAKAAAETIGISAGIMKTSLKAEKGGYVLAEEIR